MSQIETTYEVNDLPSALKMAFERCPALVILDTDLNGTDVWMAVRRIKARWPQARCILLANDAQQFQEGESAGADAVLLKGFPAARLAATIVGLLSQKGGREEGDRDDAVVSVHKHRRRMRRGGKRGGVILWPSEVRYQVGGGGDE
jgi:DNA-binding response OmpR family regulator